MRLGFLHLAFAALCVVTARAERTLRDAQSDLLPPGAVGRLSSVRFRHDGLVADVAFVLPPIFLFRMALFTISISLSCMSPFAFRENHRNGDFIRTSAPHGGSPSASGSDTARPGTHSKCFMF